MEQSAGTEHRLTLIEERLTALETASREADRTSIHDAPADGELWLLEELPRHGRFPAGSVIFAGEVAVGGRHAQYQWHRPTHVLAEQPWDENLERLAALAHPVRGTILRRLLSSPVTVTELVDERLASSTGAAYHHLGALQAGGWITRESGGRHALRPARIVPLLTIIAATEDH